MDRNGGASAKLSDIGVDLPLDGSPTDFALKEQRQFELDRVRENNRHDAEKENRRLGTIGRFFGSRDNAIVYIVAVLVLVCVACVAILAFFDNTLRSNAFEFFKTVSIALVGFFAGRALPNKEE